MCVFFFLKKGDFEHLNFIGYFAGISWQIMDPVLGAHHTHERSKNSR
jgi:hypothetical protein